MKLNGLNNMAFQGLQKQSPKPSSEKGAKSSFEEVLGQTKVAAQPKPTDKPQEKKEVRDQKPDRDQSTSREGIKNTEGQKPSLKNSREDKNQSKQQSPDQANVQSVEPDALPMQPNAPTLNGPINDRMVSGKPVGETNLIDTGAKDKSILPQDDGIDSLTRRVVWNDFLRKMKDDLGVSAEDVLAAFAQLTDEELAQPPQETVNTVVAALGLDSGQAKMAKGYFSELVSKTKSQSMGEELGKSEKQINLTLMSQREAHRKTLNRGIDKLQQNFFMKNPQAAAQMMTQAQEDGRGRDPLATPGISNMEMIEVGAPAAALPGMAVSQAPENFPSMAHVQASPLASNLEKVKAQPKNTIDEMVRNFLSPQPKLETLKAGEVSAATVAAAQAGGIGAADSAAQAAAAGSMSAGSLKGLLADLTSGDSEEDGEYSSDASYLGAGLTGEKAHSLNGPSAEFQAELAKAEKTPMSVPDLVDKAQIMVSEGGGEMKVTLTNEGMGEVAMKVNVQDGKVQIQMVTESDDAKKLIERTLSELKNSLNANDLKLDSIKIDTASNLGKQLEQQYQDAQRQSTQTAWEQFRQDNQGWRRSFFETPSAKLYKGQGEAPRDVQAPSSQAQRKNANRRLDLVA